MILFAAALLAAAQPAACAGESGAAQKVCVALAAQKAGRFAESAGDFEAGAPALKPGDPASDRMLAAAGNMWIAAGQPAKAALALDKALAGTGLLTVQRGEALLDRARAAEAQNDLKTARARLNEAAGTVSDDPFYWYFSAALAIRELDKPTAQMAINRALSLAPSDPTVLFEAGHVAHFTGDLAKARGFWTRAAAADPTGPMGKAARDALALPPAPVTAKAPAAKAQ